MARKTEVFNRSALTTDLLEHLRAELNTDADIVGDGYAPDAGGWTGGQPGSGEFIPYVVLVTGQALPKDRSALALQNEDWSSGYTLRSVGASREQADWMADAGRSALVGYAPRHLELAGQGWKVQRLAFSGLGSVDRNTATTPAFWETIDSWTVWLSRDLG